MEIKPLIDSLKLQIESGVDTTVAMGASDRLQPNKTTVDNHIKQDILSSNLPKNNSHQSNNSVAMINKKSNKIASECKTLDDLKHAIESFDGLSITKTALNTVFADGNPLANVMLIGEAPGADEDRTGKPFVGRSGQLLDNMFKFIGLSRKENLYITNVINWRPPGNRPPTTQEISTCLPFLKRHIELVNPKVIVMLGATSLKAIINSDKPISKVRGKIIDLNINDLGFNVVDEPQIDNQTPSSVIKAITMYHPSYLLRSPSKKSIAMLDLIKIKQTVNSIIIQ